MSRHSPTLSGHAHGEQALVAAPGVVVPPQTFLEVGAEGAEASARRTMVDTPQHSIDVDSDAPMRGSGLGVLDGRA
eukprot:scaffold238545_cov30-Tisochrysis_lutea.AAC.1